MRLAVYGPLLLGTPTAILPVRNVDALRDARVDRDELRLDGGDLVLEIGDERLSHAEVMERLKQQPGAAQVLVNLAEASHRTIFVAGWRPFIGWVCGMALGYNFILRDLITWALTAWWPTVALPPALQMDQLMTVLLGLLGLGTLRTVEKIGGLTR